MPTRAAREAYTRWVLEDTRYQRARLHNIQMPAAGEERDRRALQLAQMAKSVKDAWDRYMGLMEVT